MQYLAALGGGGGGIESKVVQTSCILEAFGNVKIARNNNSSRFVSSLLISFLLVLERIHVLVFCNQCRKTLFGNIPYPCREN